MDLGLSMDLTPPHPESAASAEWEMWGEEPTILICEVSIETRRGPTRERASAMLKMKWLKHCLAVLTRPLPGISHPCSRLVDMSFYCPPPPAPDAKEPHTLHLVATFSEPDDCG